MPLKLYKIASQEGASFVLRFGLQAEPGDQVELDLGMKEAETALLAAGWLEEVKAKKKEA
jgi:hypothetical protein